MTVPRSCIPCEKIENDSYDWYQRHEKKCCEARKKKADIIFIGDSITHFWSPEDDIGYGKECWQQYYGNRNVLNLGYGFDRTQNMLWRITSGELENQDPALVVINAGTNQFTITPNYDGDTPETAFEGVKRLIEVLHQMLPGAQLLVMAVFPRQPPEEYQHKIDQLNKLLQAFLSGPGGEKNNARFLDITCRFRTPDGKFNSTLFEDGACHPNEAGYRVWAEALEPEIRRCLDK